MVQVKRTLINDQVFLSRPSPVNFAGAKICILNIYYIAK